VRQDTASGPEFQKTWAKPDAGFLMPDAGGCAFSPRSSFVIRRASGIWHLASGIWHLASGIWHLASGICYPVSFPHMSALSHINAHGDASMVDVSGKPVSRREAVARGEIRLQPTTLDLIESNQIAKGNVLATARLAGIMAAKRTGDLIPLCHPLPITHCEVLFEIPASRDHIVITASAKITAQTGIEMEALTAVSVAALTIYDMCKAVDKQMVIGEVKLVSKTKQPI
jgi:cyclic pyranopterin phosphate synthase